MASREHESVQRAVDLYLTGTPILLAARAEGLHPSTLHRALNRRNIERRGPAKGQAHHTQRKTCAAE